MKKLFYLLAIAVTIAVQSCGNHSGSSTGESDSTANPVDSASKSITSVDTSDTASIDKAKETGVGSATQATASTDIKGIVWKELEKLPLASDPSKEESIGVAVIQPSAPAERHSHVENEVGYVLEGESLLEVDGEPARTIRAGDSFAIPAGRVHRAKTTGSVPLKVVVTYIVAQGQPLARPAK
ncbi:cupin domain-containing protein [Mucilaginibacter lutimaris]|uniref:Cupin domain-containing protein n=1 Tax=Mucilaginibacter lutimaris TaxID=931629 RepID=A0ABW2ZLP7_9SPHI